MFAEDTSAFMQDFGVQASVKPAAGSWTFDGIAPNFSAITFTFDGATTYTATVIFDQPEGEVLGGRALSKEYEILYRTLDLPGLVAGVPVTVAGVQYEVIDARTIDDGVFSRAVLEL